MGGCRRLCAEQWHFAVHRAQGLIGPALERIDRMTRAQPLCALSAKGRWFEHHDVIAPPRAQYHDRSQSDRSGAEHRDFVARLYAKLVLSMGSNREWFDQRALL